MTTVTKITDKMLQDAPESSKKNNISHAHNAIPPPI